jgi:hypothetical protein
MFFPGITRHALLEQFVLIRIVILEPCIGRLFARDQVGVPLVSNSWAKLSWSNFDFSRHRLGTCGAEQYQSRFSSE